MIMRNAGSPILMITMVLVTLSPDPTGAGEAEGGCKTLYDSYNFSGQNETRRDAHGDDSGWGITIIGFANQSAPHSHANGLDVYTLDHTWGFFNTGHDVCT